eukprot:c18193_g1_i1 orf=359-3379(-)
MEDCEQASPSLACLGKPGFMEIAQAWSVFCTIASKMPSRHHSDKTVFFNCVAVLCGHGLRSLVIDYFLNHLEVIFKEHCATSFWKCFENFAGIKDISQERREPMQLYVWIQSTLPQALQDVCSVKTSQEDAIALLMQSLQACNQQLEPSRRGQATAGLSTNDDVICKYQTSVTALLLTSAPKYFSEILNLYFKARLEDFSRAAKKRIVLSKARNDSDQEGDVCEASEGCNSENDDLESVFSGWRDSDSALDTGNGSSVNLVEAENDDQYGACDMEGVVFPSLCQQAKTEPGRSVLDITEVAGSLWVMEVAKVVQNLQQLGFSAMTEEACASAVYSLLKDKIYAVATKRYEKPVLAPIRQWIKVIPLQFLQVVLDSPTPARQDFATSFDFPSPLAASRFESSKLSKVATERIVRWHLRLEFFAYETLGNLRINELFDIIVDYPESLPAIEDLRHCLANTGHHTKLVDSFRTALRHRLLTAGAATTDILLQYISTIKALRTMDHTGVFLEAVGEPIREYLRSRKDTIRCIVTMLTDDTGAGGASALGGVGESLLEELSRGTTVMDNVDSEDEGVADDEDAWGAAERWEPDPVEADPSRTSKSRRSMDIIGMLVGIYGSKELFVNEYRIMLAEKLLSKSDYDIDREIRTLELLKLRFGENSMHSCEIMLKDIADSKRINSNIKANTLATSPMVRPQPQAFPVSLAAPAAPAVAPSVTSTSRNADPGSRLAAFVARARGVFSQTEQTPGSPSNTNEETTEKDLCLEALNATIISALFWPPFQVENIKIPDVVDNLLEDYAQRYHALKAPRKLQWKKHLGIVKLELQFEDRAAQFMVSPMHASIIMLFEDCNSWAATDLASALGVPVATLRRRIMLWVNQGVLLESSGIKSGELYYTIIENIGDGGSRSGATALRSSDSALPLLGEDDGESAVASMEDQLQQEMNVYESYVLGMLTNFDALPLDRIHNMLKMFVSDPPYDKSLQQLQGFLSGLVSEEKLEVRDGLYRRRQV